MPTRFPWPRRTTRTLPGHRPFPWITFVLSGLLFHLTARDLDTYLLVSHTLLPVITFWLLYILYHRYVSRFLVDSAGLPRSHLLIRFPLC